MMKYLSLQNLWGGAFVVFSLMGLITFQTAHPLPVQQIFEVLLIVSAFLVLKDTSKGLWVFISLVGLYIGETFLRGYFIYSIHPKDYLISYKFFFYIILLSFFINKSVFSSQWLKKIYLFLVTLFLIKYFYINILFELFGIPLPTVRAELFVENNFELLFLSLLYFLVFLQNDKKFEWYTFILFALVMLLGKSRSGALEFFVVSFGILFNLKSRLGIKAFFFVLLTLYTGAIWQSRVVNLNKVYETIKIEQVGVKRQSNPNINEHNKSHQEKIKPTDKNYINGKYDSFQKIDRYKFLQQFLYDIKDWQIKDYFFGNSGVLTFTSNKTAETFKHFKGLYSKTDNTRFYSVIYHSFWLRVLFDHGILGVLFIVSWLGVCLRKFCRLDVFDILIVLGVFGANGLSVSSFNSIFGTMALMFYFSSYKWKGESND